MNEKIKTGIIFAVILLLVVFLNNKILWLVLFALAMIFALKEANNLFKTDTKIFYAVISIVLTFVSDKALYSAIFVLILQASYIAYKQEDLKQLASTIYAIVGISFIYEIYLSYGLNALIWVLLCTVLCDSFAYFVGRAFGKHKFCPTSPNKTIEGVIGGVLISTVLSALFACFAQNLSFYSCLMISFLMAFFSVFGDLFESYLKRLANVKDSANLFPGHGGVLDRLDALIFASVILVIFI
ncbi:phosphatidate cytidylyltransferase [Campylobacter canadensis]|uniref:Phosphatidate cytidylyltransferase n=1 Tax=Campylobacter canadensis TaxID=449520 RepID=A0ABS7WQE5_9BACT|nr:CDP-archaeol synthase [Campylobacter canadensis]MBZ7986527.1 CDP-archaeol synthase [Campylobacter canadensis]MBZ7994068.1 CDP-archaeol synthase [Campylobacter canadensis]MBZ7995929.1 CDP-archaeol synthase [Campylobacter canadensis]MBZ7997563.1 CDP-archaeol synthase [Campylobacter canadensis]MBZ7999399.1 CDP-archaeol synthase [Campylobacter canadensis]